MSNLIIRSDNTQLEIPNTEKLEITKGGLTITLSFNGKGGFNLTQNGMAVASAPATAAHHLEPGMIMPDGSVYAGTSPDTGRAFYAAAQDAPEHMDWYQAKSYAKRCKYHGHADWRVPSVVELGVLFNHRAAIGGVDQSDWYWSRTANALNLAWGQRFSDGSHFNFNAKYSALAVRCVRG